MNLAELTVSLTSQDEEVRFRALSDAPSKGEPALLDLLIASLGDESWRVRKAAADRLSTYDESEEAVGRLILALGDQDNAGTRNAAADALTEVGSPALEALLGRLEDPDEDLRKFCVDVLGEIGDPLAVEGLVGRLRDEQENVQGAAAEALGKIAGERAEQALLGALEGKDLLVTLSALDALARAGAIVPFDQLRALAPERLLRRPVLRLLARLDGEEALTGLVDGLSDVSRGTREVALSALGRWADAHDPTFVRVGMAVKTIDPSRLASLCEAALSSADVETVAAAVSVLAALQAIDLVERIIEVAEDERLRDTVERALLAMGAPITQRLTPLLDGLTSSSLEVALAVLAATGDGTTVPDIVRFLDHPSDRVRIAAVESLGRLGDHRAVEPMARLLGKPDRGLAAAVVRALSAVAHTGREDVLDVCRGLLGADDPQVVADACRVLAAVASPAETPLLQAVLRHEDPRARAGAVGALGALRSPEAADQLRFALADESPQVRAAAARALGRQGNEAAGRALIISLKDEDPEVVGAAADGLGGLGDPAYAVHLIGLIGTEEHPGSATSAYAALRAIAALEAEELVEALRRAATHPEGEVVKEAAELAAGIDGEEGTEVLLRCASHSAWDVRRKAARLLAARSDPSVLPQLRSLLASESDALVSKGLAEAIAVLEERS